MAELPAQFKTINLVLTPAMSDAKQMAALPLISAENVTQRNASFRVGDQYRAILREPIAHGCNQGCTEMVSNGKGGWLGVDWFNSSRNYDSCLIVCLQKQFDSEFCPCMRFFDRK